MNDPRAESQASRGERVRPLGTRHSTLGTLPIALAIDVGSSSARAALVDATGQPVAGTLAQAEVELEIDEGGQAQVDARRLRELVEGLIDEVLSRPAGASVEVAVVAMTTFWHSLVVLDRHGEPVTPVLTWADTRSEPEARELRRRLDAEAVHQRTGCILHPSYLPAKLLWLRRHRPGALGPGSACLSFAQYCTGVWLGSRAASVSMASGSGLLDSRRCVWDSELAAVLAVEPSAFGEIAPEPELLPPVVAAYARRWPRLCGVPWRAPLGDGAASNAGAGCINSVRVALMVGTSGALRRCQVEAQPSVLPPGVWRYRLDRSRTLVGGALSDGGSAYAWLRETLALPDEARLEAELAAREPAVHGLIVLPFWSGERATGWVGDATAMFAGIKRHTSALDLFQAAIEAVTYRFVLLYEAVCTGEETIVATGGGLLNSPAWMQVIADATWRPVVASGVAEASLRGAAMVGLRDIGLVDDATIATAPLGAAYRPRPARYEAHRAAIARQQELYAREVGPDGANVLARQTR